ncbi:MAG: hypothetical protein U5J64_06800 [Halobacteriales archaeon]|nr:hypothetical protein [Halobacteriales archaeon]
MEERVDELERELEDVKEDIERLEPTTEEDEEDEERILYVYVVYIYETHKGIFGLTERRKVLLIEDEVGYTVPSAPESSLGSTTQQALQIAKRHGVDCWDKVELVSEDEDTVYYRVEIPDEAVENLSQGYTVTAGRARELVNDWEAKEYL